jgi:hypothetical protein
MLVVSGFCQKIHLEVLQGQTWQQPSHLVDNAHGNQIGSLVNAEA